MPILKPRLAQIKVRGGAISTPRTRMAKLADVLATYSIPKVEDVNGPFKPIKAISNGDFNIIKPYSLTYDESLLWQLHREVDAFASSRRISLDVWDHLQAQQQISALRQISGEKGLHQLLDHAMLQPVNSLTHDIQWNNENIALWWRAPEAHRAEPSFELIARVEAGWAVSAAITEMKAPDTLSSTAMRKLSRDVKSGDLAVRDGSSVSRRDDESLSRKSRDLACKVFDELAFKLEWNGVPVAVLTNFQTAILAVRAPCGSDIRISPAVTITGPRPLDSTVCWRPPLYFFLGASLLAARTEPFIAGHVSRV